MWWRTSRDYLAALNVQRNNRFTYSKSIGSTFRKRHFVARGQCDVTSLISTKARSASAIMWNWLNRAALREGPTNSLFESKVRPLRRSCGAYFSTRDYIAGLTGRFVCGP